MFLLLPLEKENELRREHDDTKMGKRVLESIMMLSLTSCLYKPRFTEVNNVTYLTLFQASKVSQYISLMHRDFFHSFQVSSWKLSPRGNYDAFIHPLIFSFV